jgi:predicted NBD/HSP70 family sugar kinase
MPFAERLESALGGKVVLSNDAILVALGEALHGAGKGHDVVGYLTFSTGVGGARVSGGAVDRTAFGFEPGKLKLLHMGEGMTVEDYAAGSGLKARYNKEPFDIREEQVWIEAAKAAGYLAHTATLFWSPQILIVGGPMVLGDPAIPFDQIEMEAKRLLGERANELTLVKATLEGFGGLWGALAVYQGTVRGQS